ncbi:MAG: myo-inosose-2 dehydratase [Opitutaceae bacterium]
MSASAPSLSPVVLTGCQVGANPIIWSNDDFAELAGDLPLDSILSDMAASGYAGSELGHAYPRTSEALRAALGRHGLKLVSGWHSTHLASRALAQEEADFLTHARLLKSLGSRVVIVAECTRCVHGDRNAALGFGNRLSPRLTEDEWPRFIGGLTRLCGLAAAEGLAVVYHHHMGTVIQGEPDLERLLAAVPALRLLLDPGHLAFAGIDPVAVARRHAARIGHVHLKSVRPEVAEKVRREGWSFHRAVVNGVFTIPGEGCVDFPAIFAVLAAARYQGWLVAEAEEDPAKAPALDKARRARAYVRAQAGI